MSKLHPINPLKQIRNKKLLIQVGLIVIAIFLVIMLLIGTLVYSGSKNLYLRAKNELIERDLSRIKEDLMKTHLLSWTLDYCEAHPKEIRDVFTVEDYWSTDYADRAIAFYNNNGIDDLSVPVNDPEIVEKLNKESDETQFAVAVYNFEMVVSNFFYSYFKTNYDQAFCIDIREENRGFIYCATEASDTESIVIGETISYPVEDHPAVKTLLEGKQGVDYEDTVFETAKIGDDKQEYYIGYMPVILDGEMPCVICISFDFSPFRNSFMPYIIGMFVLGFIIMLIFAGVLLLFLHFSAIRPLKKIQTGVRNYMDDKDSENVVAAMNKIKARNEFGVLSEDISMLAREIDRYNEENVRLASEQERVAAELGLAAEIQSDMLPKQFPDLAQFDLYASMTPAKEVGGDFYDFFMIDDDHLGMVIADVSGKGVPASLFMMMSMIVIRNYARAGNSPGEVLRKANRSICENNDKEDSMFVTAWFGILELSTGHVVASNAGHEYPILGKPGSGFELFKDKHSFVLGAMDGMKYKEYEFDIEKGGALFLYTDGAPEATDTNEELFGSQRMLDALNEAPDSSSMELILRMSDAINRFVGEAPQFDDLTMLCVRYNGADGSDQT